MLSFSLHININNGLIAACNALSLSSAQLYDQSSYCVKSTLAGAAMDNDDCLPKSDDQNDNNDDNIDCDQGAPHREEETRRINLGI